MAVIDIARLNRHEKLELIEEIWKSLSHEADTIPLTTAQRAELDRRLDEVDRNGPSGISWDEVLRRLRSKT